MRIVWTGPAIRDLVSLRNYIAGDKAAAADSQVNRIITMVAGLASFPHSGRPGRRPETRELVVGKTPYLVAYRLKEETIEVLRVLHSRQRWPDRL
jgi:toxin ParE1/3/4